MVEITHYKNFKRYYHVESKTRYVIKQGRYMYGSVVPSEEWINLPLEYKTHVIDKLLQTD